LAQGTIETYILQVLDAVIIIFLNLSDNFVGHVLNGTHAFHFAISLDP
jgi:hypothetical protein